MECNLAAHEMLASIVPKRSCPTIFAILGVLGVLVYDTNVDQLQDVLCNDGGLEASVVVTCEYTINSSSIHSELLDTCPIEVLS